MIILRHLGTAQTTKLLPEEERKARNGSQGESQKYLRMSILELHSRPIIR
jgi:hypothetical protein